jgi:TonB family protein
MPRQGFCLFLTRSLTMKPVASFEVYSPREIAQAAGVPEDRVLAALGGRNGFVPHQDAVVLGRALVGPLNLRTGDVAELGRRVAVEAAPIFAVVAANAARRPTGVPLAVSSTLHVGAIAAIIFIATFGQTPGATTFQTPALRPEDMRLVFLSTPGPGGGGGGGGRLQQAPPPKALRKGTRQISSPMPVRQPPRPVEPVQAPPDPKPAPLNAEVLPVVVAPIVTAPADDRDRNGVLQQARAEAESRGPGQGGGAGSGKGTGIGEGDGAGIGPGSGGGTGGGPFRPGSGIEPPRLLREVKADYSDEARRAGITGDVVLEIVVRRDGTVGDVKILQGLAGGLNERAVQAVRQWRFAAATRRGAPVDVIVEVAVAFKLR